MSAVLGAGIEGGVGVSLDRAEAERRSHLPDVLVDAAHYGTRFCGVDRSVHLYRTLGITEPWDEWEWPRRLAAIRLETANRVTPSLTQEDGK
jgi:hypothetical protein